MWCIQKSETEKLNHNKCQDKLNQRKTKLIPKQDIKN